jgi:hypothetical protein
MDDGQLIEVALKIHAIDPSSFRSPRTSTDNGIFMDPSATT